VFFNQANCLPKVRDFFASRTFDLELTDKDAAKSAGRSGKIKLAASGLSDFSFAIFTFE
jgi:hypothetical protein